MFIPVGPSQLSEGKKVIPCGVPCSIFSVSDLCISFWLLMMMANRNFILAASSTICGTVKSSGMTTISVIKAFCLSLASMDSAYIL